MAVIMFVQTFASTICLVTPSIVNPFFINFYCVGEACRFMQQIKVKFMSILILKNIITNMLLAFTTAYKVCKKKPQRSPTPVLQS